MIRNIIWKGIGPESMEFCRIRVEEDIKVNSSIVGCQDNVPFKADYKLEMSADWVISSFQLMTCLGNSEQSLHLTHDGYGNWSAGGKAWKHLDDCLDIDISVTPFTNSLPVNRLHPDHGICTDIDVVYIDVLHFGIHRATQHYTRLGGHRYRFVSGDFTADITMDDQNLVSYYPGLFSRSLIRD